MVVKVRVVGSVAMRGGGDRSGGLSRPAVCLRSPARHQSLSSPGTRVSPLPPGSLTASPHVRTAWTKVCPHIFCPHSQGNWAGSGAGSGRVLNIASPSLALLALACNLLALSTSHWYCSHSGRHKQLSLYLFIRVALSKFKSNELTALLPSCERLLRYLNVPPAWFSPRRNWRTANRYTTKLGARQKTTAHCGLIITLLQYWIRQWITIRRKSFDICLKCVDRDEIILTSSWSL